MFEKEPKYVTTTIGCMEKATKSNITYTAAKDILQRVLQGQVRGILRTENTVFANAEEYFAIPTENASVKITKAALEIGDNKPGTLFVTGVIQETRNPIDYAVKLAPRYFADADRNIGGIITFDLVYDPQAERKNIRQELEVLRQHEQSLLELQNNFRLQTEMNASLFAPFVEKLNEIQRQVAYPLFERDCFVMGVVEDFFEDIDRMLKDIHRWEKRRERDLNRKYYEFPL